MSKPNLFYVAIAIGASMHAANGSPKGPTEMCSTSRFAGYCAVDMSDPAYASLCASAPVTYSDGAKAPICIESFAAATQDMRIYFANENAGTTKIGLPYLITIDAGTYDLSKQTTYLGRAAQAIVNVSSTVPTIPGERLVISGAGAGSTELITAPTVTTILGVNVSHLTVQGLHLARPSNHITQGYVSAVGPGYVTIDIQKGFINQDTWDGKWHFMRLYDNSNPANPTLIPSFFNRQIDFTSAQHVKGGRYTLMLSNPTFDPTAWGYAAGSFVCVKNEGASASVGYFNDSVSGGTDIILNGMEWTQAGRSEFDGVSNVQILNSAILRGPTVGGQAACVSTDSGGPQIGNPFSHAYTWGNVVDGYTAQATGDDSIAFFSDIGGTTRNGTNYPASTVQNTTISDGFARFINVYTGRTGNNTGWGGQTIGNTYVDCAEKRANFACPVNFMQ